MSANNRLNELQSQEFEPASPLFNGRPRPSARADTSDGQMLLRAIQARLRTIVGETHDSNGAARAGDSLTRSIHADVLECVVALDTLQATLTQDLNRRRQLEREFTEAQAALAQSKAELADARQDERPARYVALHDSLTALPNRRCFGEELDRALAQSAPDIAVFYLDLDGLKLINDRHGRGTGDELLKIVAARLRRALRTQDSVCRLDGDEFACLLTDPLSRDQLGHLACKLFDTVSAPMQIGELGLVMRASIGIATYPDDGATGAELLKRADTAMYRAKREQTGYAFYGESAENPVIASAGVPLRAAMWMPAHLTESAPSQASTSAAAATTQRRTQV
jgi:diguanylate cyclase (GGDEF)-like protein